MPEKHIKKIENFKKPALLIGILIVLFFILKHSFYLRSIGYDQIPETYVILDERTNVWHGLSISQTGVPAAWSNLNVYMQQNFGGEVDGLNVKIDGKKPNLTNFSTFPKPGVAVSEYDFGRGLRHLRFVQPYLDHPPFGALVLSSFVKEDVKTFSDLTPAAFRRGSLWLGILTGLLTFIVGWQITKNPLVGLLASAIYSSVPTYILLSRYALLENVLSPIILASVSMLILAKSYLERQTDRKYLFKILLVLAGVFCGLAALTKIVGWFMLIIGILLLVYWRINYKQILFFFIPATFVGLLYFAWGLYLDPKLFIDIFRYQSIDRGFVGSLNFLTAAKGIGILNFPFDGWWIGGFVSLLLVPFKKEYIPVIFSVAAILITTLVLGGANYPWYYIPLIPFMCVMTAVLIWRVVFQPNFLSIIIFFLVFFSSSFFWGYGVFQADKLSTNYMQPYQTYRLALIVFLLLGLLSIFSTRFKFQKLYLGIWFIFMLVVVYQLWEWNTQSVLFILSHWGKFPTLYTPGTF